MIFNHTNQVKQKKWEPFPFGEYEAKENKKQISKNHTKKQRILFVKHDCIRKDTLHTPDHNQLLFHENIRGT